MRRGGFKAVRARRFVLFGLPVFGHVVGMLQGVEEGFWDSTSMRYGGSSATYF